MPRKKIEDNPAPTLDGKVIAAVEEKRKTDKGEQVLNYNKPLDEIDNEQNNISNEEPEDEFSDFEDDREFETQEIPKDPINVMFDNLLEIDEYGNQTFYAMVLRLPDAMSDNFRVKSQSQMSLGTQAFSIRDRFIFQSALQKLNGDSGMRCAIRVCYENGKEVTINRVVSFHASVFPVGIAHLVIPNPVIINEKQNNNGNQNQISDREFYAEQQRKSDERLTQILTAIKPSNDGIQAQIMAALIPAMINNTLNPPQHSNPSLLSDIVKNELFQIKAIGQMFPEPPPPAEPDWIDKANKIVNIPVVANLIDAATVIAESSFAANLQTKNVNNIVNQNSEQQSEQENPNQLHTNNQMEDLIAVLIDEIESENEINLENPTIINLQTNYPPQFQIVKTFCKTAPFPAVFEMLINLTASMQQSPFVQYLDIEEMQKTQSKSYIWNERGVRMQARLTEVYELVKTIE